VPRLAPGTEADTLGPVRVDALKRRRIAKVLDVLASRSGTHIVVFSYSVRRTTSSPKASINLPTTILNRAGITATLLPVE
jgi:hypothetical protein